ncbi:arginase [Caldibacillus debilis]|uniref:arginase n=1 Tax=Caldibacillus debilis TaxID=301148 RepID=UPI000360A31F|nr:arginase [Caldibacillus debilis]
MEKKIAIVGMPMSYGQPHPGVALGPDAVRHAGLTERLRQLGLAPEDMGNMEIGTGERTVDTETGMKNLHQVAEACEQLAAQVDHLFGQNFFPLVLGGDHSMAIGTIAGAAKHFRNPGILWIDAHGDLNTPETSPSGNIHGMPLAASLGLGAEPLINLYGSAPKIRFENIVLIGIRDLDEGEKRLIRERKIKAYTMHEIDRAGMKRVMEEAIAYLRERADGVHLSFDLDSLDPSEAPGVGTPVKGGLTFREARLAMEMLGESGLIASCEFVEVNPLLDTKNQTAGRAVDLIAALFGHMR